MLAKRCLYMHKLRSAQLVDAAIRKKRRVLVHCSAGQNRSASICAAYLILYRGWAPANRGFAKILRRLTPGK